MTHWWKENAEREKMRKKILALQQKIAEYEAFLNSIGYTHNDFEEWLESNLRFEATQHSEKE